MDTIVSVFNTLAPVLAPLGQIGFAAAAWRMAAAIRVRVDDHEVRIQVLEKTEK